MCMTYKTTRDSFGDGAYHKHKQNYYLLNANGRMNLIT